MQEVSGATARLSLRDADGVKPGDEFSALQYGYEIARLRITAVTKTDSVADILLQQPGVILRRLDTVVPTTALPKPSTTLEPLPPPLPGQEVKPSRRKRRRARSRDAEAGTLVSRADWTYPALSSLVERELLSGVAAREFHGDQQLTRGEIRELIAEALETAAERRQDVITPPQSTAPAADGSVSPSPAAAMEGAPSSGSEASAGNDASPAPRSPSVGSDRLLYHLAQEYGLDPGMPVPKRGPALTSTHRYRLVAGEKPHFTTGTNQALMSLGRDQYAVVSLSRERREWYGDHDYPWLNEAFYHTHWLGVNWDVGQRALRWGPGYTGSMILGDVAPSLPMVRGTRGLSLGRTFGYWNAEGFASRTTESGGARYLLGHRLSHAFSPSVSFGLSETSKAAKAPNPLALVLPFQLYQKLFEKSTNVINIQVGLDLRVAGRHQEGYGELFIDDITAPKGLGQAPVPRKIGFLAGYRYANLFGDEGTDVRVEYAQTDSNAYLHRNPTISYFNRGIPLGHPMGPNSKSYMVRADRRLTPKLEVTAAAQVLRPKGPITPTTAKGTAFTLAAAYDLRNDRSLTLKLSPGSRVDRYTVERKSSLELIADWNF